MRIKKVSQTTPSSAQIVDGYSNSTNDGYSCNYVNGVVGVVLYEEEDNPVGTGTITLNDNISNYRKVDITFLNNDNEACGVTVYNPSGKKICLQSSHAGGATYYNVSYFSYITLSGTTGTYSEGRVFTITNQKVILDVTACDTQKITSIIGYK